MQSDEKYLEAMCPAHLPITKAPRLLDLQLIVDQSKGKIKEYDLLKAESEKLYSSLDSNRNIFLIKNPVIWETEFKYDESVKYSATSRIRPRPIPFGNHENVENNNKKRKF